MKSKFIFGLIGILLFGEIQATENAHMHDSASRHIHGSHEECPLPKSSQDIVDCAVSLHPSIKKSRLRIDSSKNLESLASQIPNPSFSARYVIGDNAGEDIGELESNLTFQIEMGGKRNARKEFAKAKNREAEVLSEDQKINIKIETILKMYRLRQIISEHHIISDALAAFSKIIKKLKSLSRLSSQQEATLTLFEMAYEEAKINESKVFEEERELEHFFHIATGHSFEEIKKFLPRIPQKWPDIEKNTNKNISANVTRLKVYELLAKKEFEIQKSKSWSNLQLGPSFSIEKEGGDNHKLVGINLQIPLPLFQSNGGGKAFARSKLLRAQKNIEITKAEESHERYEQQRVYASTVSILNRTLERKDIEKKHKKIEGLYFRGVVTSSVYLESLKQKINYFKLRNEREITALKALWKIHRLDGRTLKEKL